MPIRLVVKHPAVSDTWNQYGSFLSQALGHALFPVHLSIMSKVADLERNDLGLSDLHP